MKIPKSHIERLLSADEEDASQALSDLSNFWFPRAKLSETDELTGLSPAETAAHLARHYFGEVRNGGHIQYFWNSSGSLAHETIAILEKLGLEQAAQILRNAVQVFPNGQVPKQRAVRIAQIGPAFPAFWWYVTKAGAYDGFGRRELDLLDDANLALWEMDQTQSDIVILRYLQKHKDEVLIPEQS